MKTIIGLEKEKGVEEVRGLFRYDGKLNQFLSKIMYIVSLNLLFLLCSIPIITIGAAYTAMYTVLFRLQEGDEPDILKTFFQAFRANFRKSVLAWMMVLGMGIILWFNYYFVFQMQLAAAEVIRVVLNIILLLFIMIWVYLFPVISYYDNTMGGYLDFIVRMGIGRLPVTLLLVLVQAVPLCGILYLAQYMTMAMLVFLCCGFSLSAYLSVKILNKYFAPCGEESV